MLALWWCHSATGTEGTQLSGGKCTHALQKNVTKCRFFSLVRDAVASLHRDEKKKRHLMLHGFMHGVKISCADCGSVGVLSGTKRGKMPKVPFIVIIVWVCLYNHKAFLLISTWGLPLVLPTWKHIFLWPSCMCYFIHSVLLVYSITLAVAHLDVRVQQILVS